MWPRLLPYHLRLAARSLRRDPGLSVTIVIVMAVVSGIFSTALMHYLRSNGELPDVSPGLHHVQVSPPPGALQRAFIGTSAESNAVATQTRISYPIYRLLSGSGIPSRATATFRSRLLVRAEDGGSAAAPAGLAAIANGPCAGAPRNARFVDADFFALFGVAFRYGAPWTRDQQASGAPVVVLSRSLNDQLFGGADSVGRALTVNGRRYRVTGVWAQDQPFVPEWDRAVAGGSQDVLFLPFPEHLRLWARPEMPVHMTPIGPGYDDLLASDEIFLTYWIELATPAQRDAYARYLAATLGPRHITYVLRDMTGVRRDLRLPHSAVGFFLFVTFIIVLAGGAIMARLLLAKGLFRRDELGIFRVLGAPRRALFARQLLEAGLLAAVAASLSLLISGGAAFFYNRAVADTDIPLSLSTTAVAITFGVTLAVGLLFAIFPSWRAANRPPMVTGGAR